LPDFAVQQEVDWQRRPLEKSLVEVEGVQGFLRQPPITGSLPQPSALTCHVSRTDGVHEVLIATVRPDNEARLSH
jgi:hypothetical protein